MTSSRIIRGTKAKIFLYVCAILIITGLIACYNNTLSQLDDLRKSNEICHQNEENLSTQLQVISDYKQRIEKALKTEKAEHQQTKNNLENKLNEEKSKSEKLSSDSVLKYNSLQQHYNLLQTQHDDFKEESSKTQQKQLEEINDLQSKLKEVQEELKKVKSSKESLKSEYTELQAKNDNLKNQLEQKPKDADQDALNFLSNKYHELEKQFQKLQDKCSNYDTLQEPKGISPETVNFNKADLPLEEKKQELNVLPVPSDNKKGMSSSSTTKSGLKPSQGSLNGARPLLVPTVTPETPRKVPEGVVAVPRKKEDEHPEIVNNRYQNKIEKAKDDVEKENGAHEVFDAPPVPNVGFDGIAFGENEAVKQAEKKNFDKKHIDTLGAGDKDRKQYEQDYKELQNDVQLEEQEEDGDADDYDHLARQKDPAIRN